MTLHFQSKLVAGELIGETTHGWGIGVFAVMPVTITEPADRAKNIVGELLHKISRYSNFSYITHHFRLQ